MQKWLVGLFVCLFFGLLVSREVARLTQPVSRLGWTGLKGERERRVETGRRKSLFSDSHRNPCFFFFPLEFTAGQHIW